MADEVQTLTKTDRNLWNAILAEAVALLRYNAYAIKAMEEGHPEVAQIFQETAGAESIHGMTHMKVAGEIKTTIENLRSVTAGELKEFSAVYPRMIREALDEGRPDAAHTFAMAMDREKHHIEAFMRALDTLQRKIAVEPERERLSPPAGVLRVEISQPAMAPAAGRDQQDSAATAVSDFPKAVREVERERWRVATFGRIREVVFGAQDGLLSTLALVTSVAAAVSGNTTVVVAGLAGALAGMISMGTGSFLGSRAQQQVMRAEIEKEARELEENPAEEMAELVFLYHQQGMNYSQAQEMAEHIASDKDLWLRTLVEKELGISPDVLGNPVKDGLAMGLTFVLAAMIPIIPYFFLDGGAAIAASVSAALSVLFILGMGKGRLVQRSPVLQGLEILVIGSVAAGLGFLLGDVIPRLVS